MTIENVTLLEGILNRKDRWLFDESIYVFNDEDESRAQFERGYLRVREKEERILEESDIKSLPYLPESHKHSAEWGLRIKSVERITSYLKAKETNGPVLDLGCGNGWFTNSLCQTTSSIVFGVDINRIELNQAASIFNKENLFFCYTNIWDDPFKKGVFQTITLNGSIQYFPSFHKIISKLLELLIPNGEIHIIDSPFYNSEEVKRARKRTKEYYMRIGENDFAKSYFHHTWDVLNGINSEIRYKKGLFRRFTKDSPFPWIVITKN